MCELQNWARTSLRWAGTPPIGAPFVVCAKFLHLRAGVCMGRPGQQDRTAGHQKLQAEYLHRVVSHTITQSCSEFLWNHPWQPWNPFSPGTLSGLEPFQFLEPFSPGVLCSPGALGIPSALSALVPLHTAGMRLPCSNSGMCPEMSHRHHSSCLHSPSLLSQGLFPFLSVPFNPYPGTSICIISILPSPTPHLKDLPGSLGHTNSLGCKRTGCKTQLPPVHPSLCFPVSFAVSCGSQSTPELRHFPPGVDCSMCPLSGQES